jgi:hypothetical protein
MLQTLTRLGSTLSARAVDQAMAAQEGQSFPGIFAFRLQKRLSYIIGSYGNERFASLDVYDPGHAAR